MTEATLPQPITFALRLRNGFAHMPSCAPELRNHAWKVALFYLCISLVLWLARPEMRFGNQLIYSFANALVAWTLIDGGRFFIDQQSPYLFPRGVKGVALILFGAVAGYIGGTWLGNLYVGYCTWDF